MSVESPCNGVCRLGAGEFCVGCGRTLSEIAEWPSATPERRVAVRQAAAIRLRDLPPGGDAGRSGSEEPRR